MFRLPQRAFIALFTELITLGASCVMCGVHYDQRREAARGTVFAPKEQKWEGKEKGGKSVYVNTSNQKGEGGGNGETWKSRVESTR